MGGVRLGGRSNRPPCDFLGHRHNGHRWDIRHLRSPDSHRNLKGGIEVVRQYGLLRTAYLGSRGNEGGRDNGLRDVEGIGKEGKEAKKRSKGKESAGKVQGKKTPRLAKMGEKGETDNEPNPRRRRQWAKGDWEAWGKKQIGGNAIRIRIRHRARRRR